jgi:hypothetical protein
MSKKKLGLPTDNTTTLWFANFTRNTVEPMFVGSPENCKATKDAMIANGWPINSFEVSQSVRGTRFRFLRVVAQPTVGYTV